MAKVYNVDIMSKQKVFLKILFLNILISQDDFLGDCVCFIFFKTVRDNWILNTTQLSKKSWNLKATTRFFFSIWVFFHEHSRFTGQQGKGEGIYLTPLYHFHPLHRHLDISQAITADRSPLHIAGSRTRSGNL